MEFAEIEELWNKILETIKKELNPQAYNSWFSKTKVVKFGENELIISAPGDFCKDWLEKHYSGFIKDILKRTLGSDDSLKIEFIATDQKFSAPTHSTPKLKVNKKKSESSLKNNELALTSKYTFDNFVVGDSNRFAHAACLAVAQSPAKSYNLLFVYGIVGLDPYYYCRHYLWNTSWLGLVVRLDLLPRLFYKDPLASQHLHLHQH